MINRGYKANMSNERLSIVKSRILLNFGMATHISTDNAYHFTSEVSLWKNSCFI